MDALQAAGVQVGPEPDRGRRAHGRGRRRSCEARWPRSCAAARPVASTRLLGRRRIAAADDGRRPRDARAPTTTATHHARRRRRSRGLPLPTDGPRRGRHAERRRARGRCRANGDGTFVAPARRAAAEVTRRRARRSPAHDVVLDPGPRRRGVGRGRPGRHAARRTSTWRSPLEAERRLEALGAHGRAHPHGRLPHHARDPGRDRHGAATRRCSCRSTTTPTPTGLATGPGPRPTSRSATPSRSALGRPGLRGGRAGVLGLRRGLGGRHRTPGQVPARRPTAATTTASCAARPACRPCCPRRPSSATRPRSSCSHDPAFQARGGRGHHPSGGPLRHHRRPRLRLRRALPAHPACRSRRRRRRLRRPAAALMRSSERRVRPAGRAEARRAGRRGRSWPGRSTAGSVSAISSGSSVRTSASVGHRDHGDPEAAT